MDELKIVALRKGVANEPLLDSAFKFLVMSSWSAWPEDKRSFFKKIMHKKQLLNGSSKSVIVQAPFFPEGIHTLSKPLGTASYRLTAKMESRSFSIGANAGPIMISLIKQSEKAKQWCSENKPDAYIFVITAATLDGEHHQKNGVYVCGMLSNGIIEKESFIIADKYDDLRKIKQDYENFGIKTATIFVESVDNEDENDSIKRQLNTHDDLGIFTFPFSVIEQHINESQLKQPIGKQESLSESQKKNIRLGVIGASVTCALLGVAIAPQMSSILFLRDTKQASTYIKNPPELLIKQSSEKTKVKDDAPWMLTDYQTYTSQQFKLEYGVFDPSPQSVVQYMYYLGAQFPKHLFEYSLQSIEYKDASYYSVIFKRNKESNSDVTFLDQAMVFVNSTLKSNFVRFVPQRSKNIQKDVVEYRFSVQNENQYTSELDKIRSAKETEMAMVDIADRIKKTQSKLSGVKGRFDSLNWFSMFSQPNIIKKEFDKTVMDGNKALKEFKKLSNDLRATIISGVPAKNTTRSIDDFSSIKNVDDRFTWSEHKLIATIPDQKALEENKKRKKKNDGQATKKSAKNGTQKKNNYVFEDFGPAINVFEIKVTSNTSGDVDSGQKNNSMALTDLLLFSTLMNKPFVYIRSISYNPIKETWDVVMVIPELIDDRAAQPFYREKFKEN